jgi:hypothetical protein
MYRESAKPEEPEVLGPFPYRQRHKCPACGDTWLIHVANKTVIIDEGEPLLRCKCTECGCVWITYGRLHSMRRVDIDRVAGTVIAHAGIMAFAYVVASALYLLARLLWR